MAARKGANKIIGKGKLESTEWELISASRVSDEVRVRRIYTYTGICMYPVVLSTGLILNYAEDIRCLNSQ